MFLSLCEVYLCGGASKNKMSLQDTEELKANLFTYKEQLKQVKELLVVDSGNTEYQEMAIGLTEGSTTPLHAREDLFRSFLARYSTIDLPVNLASRRS